MLTCEICGKAQAKDGLWILCPDCFKLYGRFLEFVKQYDDVGAKELEPLKQILRTRDNQRYHSLFSSF